MFRGLAYSVVDFYLLPDRDGVVRQQGSVESTEFFIVAAIDDLDGGHVFFAQPGDGVDFVPVGGVVGREGSGDVSVS